MMARPYRKLKAARVERNLTQEDIARLLGLSIEGYRDKENNNSDFKKSEIDKLLQFFGMSYENLFLPSMSHNKEINSHKEYRNRVKC